MTTYIYIYDNKYKYINFGTLVLYDDIYYKLDFDYKHYFMVYVQNNIPKSLSLNNVRLNNTYTLTDEIFNNEYGTIINPRISLTLNIENPSDLTSEVKIIICDNEDIIEEYNLAIDNTISRNYNFVGLYYMYVNNLIIKFNQLIIGDVILNITGDTLF